MNAFCGLFQRDGHNLSRSRLSAMAQALGWEHSECAWQEGPVALMQRSGAPYVDLQSGLIAVGYGRIDNRPELERALLASPAESVTLPQNALFLRAYHRWGDDCPTRIDGDWAFAVWNSREQRLFSARDQHSSVAIYYHCDPHLFAFAPDLKALLALNLCPREMDEEYLARILVARPGRQADRTIHRSIRCLLPAHSLTVDTERLSTRPYWRLEEIPELRLPHRQDYVEAFREVFDAAIRARITPATDRTTVDTDQQSGIAVALSGGLDSSAVAATAAAILRERGQSLTAFTSAPLYDAQPYILNRLGDEIPLAQAICRQAGNIDLVPVEGRTVTPIQAIRCMLDILGEPGHASGSFYWLLELQRMVKAHGCRTLLTGQSGNGTISWPGSPLSHPPAFQLKRLGGRRWVREHLRRTVPTHWITARRRRRIDVDEWRRRYPIHPDFALRLNVFELWLNDPDEVPMHSPREQRLSLLRPTMGTASAKRALMGAAHGFEIQDPTADARVLAFTLSVPDHIFIDPQTGLDRWLIRAAMEGRVPDEVRFNRRRGIQAADLVPRLRACAPEVDAALDEIATGPAACYVDATHMRAIWKLIREKDTPDALLNAITVLTRGIMAGLFVNDFYS